MGHTLQDVPIFSLFLLICGNEWWNDIYVLLLYRNVTIPPRPDSLLRYVCLLFNDYLHPYCSFTSKLVPEYLCFLFVSICGSSVLMVPCILSLYALYGLSQYHN